MSITDLAQLYVTVIEPLLKGLLFFVIVIVLLYSINLLRDSKKKGDFVNAMFSFIIKAVTRLVSWVGLATVWLVKVLLNTLKVIFAAIRDFFTSKI